jgi:hypothetical protein
MSHEIYYTSAPEGLKRGSGGFCTVASTDGLPKALWDRLESLSAYRHHFSVHDSSGSRRLDGTGENPVSHAHSVLSVAGKSYHVLSRICDSGVDHTQRTNAFAHHLVVEPAEMQAAAGGPAWLLQQPGVMTTAWDDHVGTLPVRKVPTGDAWGSKVCNAWTAATGDAGWGGHLADLFVKTPTRPVCILFSPGQDLLPLMAEAIALLPVPTRWNVTFNTYFTSMPTSASCLWRCCLAGTPAATSGLRYAANGLVLDLTARDRLGRPPEGPHVALARTGISATPKVSVAAPARSKSVVAAPAAAAKTPLKAEEISDPEGDLEEELLEKQRAAILEAAPDAGEIPLAPPPGDALPAELERASRDASSIAPSIAPAHGKLPRHAMPRQPESGLIDADVAARRRRRQVMMLFGGAILTMAAGTALVFLAARHSAPPEELPGIPNATTPPRDTPPPGPTDPSTPAARTDAPLPAPTPERPTRLANEPPARSPTQNMPSTPVAPVPPPPAAPAYPDVVTLATMLERPNVGNGIGDRRQSLALRFADLDRATAVTGLGLRFPVRPADGANGKPTDGGRPNEYKHDGVGTLIASPDSREGKPGVVLRFKPRGDAAGAPPVEVLFIGFDRTRPGLDLQWRSAPLLRNPDLFPLTYWVLQKSMLELLGPRGASPGAGQRVAFKPVSLPAISLAAGSTPLPWPAALPPDVTVLPPRATDLPAGWEANWYTDWDEKDVSKRTPANAHQVLRFKKPTSAQGAEAWFLLVFSEGGMTAVESTFTRRVLQDTADRDRCAAELRNFQGQVDDARARSVTGPLEGSDAGRDLLARLDAAQKMLTGYTEALAAYRELKPFDVQFQLTDGLLLAAVRFEPPGPPGTQETGN